MALDTNLVSYWKLDESSGNATDSVGGFTLTNNNTATYAAGKINNGANFVAGSSQSLSTTNTLGISGGAISMAGWVKVDTQPSGDNVRFISHFDTASSRSATQLYYKDVAGTKSLVFNRLRMNTANDEFSYATTLTTSTWYHLAFTYDGATVTGYLNGMSIGTVSSSGDGSSSAGYSAGVYIASAQNSSNYLSGMMDEWGIWSRALSADEVSQLYNSNRALAYPLTAPTLYGGVSYWKLDESSGNASDSIGVNTLTNNNTVGYTPAKINNGADFGASNSNKTFNRTSTTGISIGARSISLWLKMNTEISSGRQDIISFDKNNGSRCSIRYEYNGGTRRLLFQSWNITDNYEPTYNVTLGTSNWAHLVLTYEPSSTLKGYLNGTEVASTAVGAEGSPFAIGDDFEIGALEGSGYLSGLVDEACIFNRALTSAEVTELYNSGSGLQYPWEDAAERGSFFMFF